VHTRLETWPMLTISLTAVQGCLVNIDISGHCLSYPCLAHSTFFFCGENPRKLDMTFESQHNDMLPHCFLRMESATAHASHPQYFLEEFDYYLSEHYLLVILMKVLLDGGKVKGNLMVRMTILLGWEEKNMFFFCLSVHMRDECF
jgi:hypothetical protein